ncbi:MAG TPA: hypothetical protein VF308_07505, partial [Caldimonas sp.]
MDISASANLPRSGHEPATGLPLSVEGVDLRFGGIHALRNVSFAAAPGQITAIIGPTLSRRVLDALAQSMVAADTEAHVAVFTHGLPINVV